MRPILYLIVITTIATSTVQAQDCHLYNKKAAEEDIKAGEAKLILPGGWGSMKYPTDTTFTRKYRVAYLHQGCVMIEDEKCMTMYNRTVAAWLDKTHGKVWRKEVRKDIYK